MFTVTGRYKHCRLQALQAAAIQHIVSATYNRTWYVGTGLGCRASLRLCVFASLRLCVVHLCVFASLRRASLRRASLRRASCVVLAGKRISIGVIPDHHFSAVYKQIRTLGVL